MGRTVNLKLILALTHQCCLYVNIVNSDPTDGILKSPSGSMKCLGKFISSVSDGANQLMSFRIFVNNRIKSRRCFWSRITGEGERINDIETTVFSELNNKCRRLVKIKLRNDDKTYHHAIGRKMQTRLIEKVKVDLMPRNGIIEKDYRADWHQ